MRRAFVAADLVIAAIICAVVFFGLWWMVDAIISGAQWLVKTLGWL